LQALEKTLCLYGPSGNVFSETVSFENEARGYGGNLRIDCGITHIAAPVAAMQTVFAKLRRKRTVPMTKNCALHHENR
jgi:hypothetical protein